MTRRHKFCLICDVLGWYPYWPVTIILNWHANRARSAMDRHPRPEPRDEL